MVFLNFLNFLNSLLYVNNLLLKEKKLRVEDVFTESEGTNSSCESEVSLRMTNKYSVPREFVELINDSLIQKQSDNEA